MSNLYSVAATRTLPAKRRLDDPSSAEPASKRRGLLLPKQAKRGHKVHHVKRSELPEDAEGFKLALETHIWILIGALTNISVPEAPDSHVIRMFEQRFTNDRDVRKLLNGRTDFQSGTATIQSIRQLRAMCAKDPSSTIVLAVSRVPEHALRVIFATVHDFGLPAWRPDLLGGTPTSLYNGALEVIALWTFEQAATTFAYAHLSPNMRYIQDTSLIQRLYKNFLWSYLKGLVLKEQKEPGSVARGIQENRAYKTRIELTKRRYQWLRENRWSERMQLLATEAECTSDQESNPDGPGFFIMYKRARNPHVTDFLRSIDGRRQQGTPLFRGQRRHSRREEPRTPHPEQRESRLSARLPRNCPLDWFAPDFFNKMDLSFRALYVDAPIALPLPIHCDSLEPPPDWKTMADDKFMEKYGNEVLKQYDVPTEEELARLAEAEAEREDDWQEEDMRGREDDQVEDDQLIPYQPPSAPQEEQSMET